MNEYIVFITLTDGVNYYNHNKKQNKRTARYMHDKAVCVSKSNLELDPYTAKAVYTLSS